MKKMKKLMTLVLAVSMVCMTGVTSFADVQGPNGDENGNVSCLTCKNEEEGHVHDASCYNHTWDNGQEMTPATCTEAGERLYTCTVPDCGKTKTEFIPAEHAWDEGEVTIAPTCTEKGETKYTCTRGGCAETKLEAVEALGHNWDEGTVTTPATDTSNGEKLFKCQREGCEATRTEVIPAKYTYVSGQSKWKTNVISFAPTSEGITYEISYQDSKENVYTQEEVNNMNQAEIKSHRLFISKITYTIPKDYEEKSVNIFVGDAINDAANYMLYVPGDAAPIQFAIVNLSSHDYAYKKGSFAVTTEEYQQYFDKGGATPTDTIGFDGQSIPREYFAYRSGNWAIAKLYDAFSLSSIKNSQLTDEELGKKLVEAGYENGIADLHKYYLDYYNDKNDTSYTALEQLPDKDIATLVTSGYTADTKETNIEVSELLYNYYYNHLYSLAPVETGYPGNTNNDYTIGEHMRNYNSGKPSLFDGSISESWSDIAASSDGKSMTYVWDGFEAWINGPDTQNPYQNYNYGFTAGFSLERTDTTYSVVTNYYTSTDGGAPALDGSVNRVEQMATNVGETVSVIPVDEWNLYDENKYKLEDSAKLSLTAVADPAANVITLNYYRNVSGQVIIPTPPIVPVDPIPPVDPPVDPDNPQPLPPDENLEDPEEPDNPTDNPNQQLPPDEHLEKDDNVKAAKSENPDQPKTGDQSQLALYLLLAAGASGALTLTVRRKRASK